MEISSGFLLRICLSLVSVGASIMLISPLFLSASGRRLPCTWLLMNVAACCFFDTLLFAFSSPEIFEQYVPGSFYNFERQAIYVLPKWAREHGICEALTCIYFIMLYSLPTALVLLTAEKLFSMFKDRERGPGIGKKNYIWLLIGSHVAIVCLVLIGVFGLTEGFAWYGHHCDARYTNGRAFYYFIVLMGLVLLCLGFLTVNVGVIWALKRSLKVRDIALPVMGTNLGFIILYFILLLRWTLNMSDYTSTTAMIKDEYSWFIRIAYTILVPVISLLCSLSSDPQRNPYTSLFVHPNIRVLNESPELIINEKRALVP